MKGSGREREGVGQTGPQASARLFGARDSCHCNASLSGRADVLLYSFGTERSVLSISCPSPPPSTIHLHLRLIVCNHAPPPVLSSSALVVVADGPHDVHTRNVHAGRVYISPTARRSLTIQTMAQLIPPPKAQERISQILPTVKCSICNQPVPLAALGEHTCAPSPPVPRPSPSQGILARIRRGSQSSRNSQVPPQTAPPQSTPPLPPNVPGRMASPAPRSQTPMSIRSKTPQPAPSPPVVVPPPQNMVGTGMMSRQRSPGPTRSQTPQMPPPSPRMPNAPPASRFDTLPRSATPQSRPAITIPSSPQKPSPLSAPGVANGYPNMSLNVAQRSPPGPRPSMDRPPSARPSMERPPSARPSMERPPSVRPSFELPPPARPSMDQRRPSMDSVRSINRPPPSLNTPGGNGPDGSNAPRGEVNMAGVGRRGFQAAAQAAMLAASLGHSVDRIRSPPNGMDGKRTNAPRHLNINPYTPSQQGMVNLRLAMQ